jgi:hypothetical protein
MSGGAENEGWGLWTADGVCLPLVRVSVKGELIGLAARLAVSQSYVNSSASSVEATFRAYLADLGTVCGVLVHVDGNEPIEAQLRRRARRAADDTASDFHDDDEEAKHTEQPEGDENGDDLFDDAGLRALNPEGDHDLFACRVGTLRPGQVRLPGMLPTTNGLRWD